MAYKKYYEKKSAFAFVFDLSSLSKNLKSVFCLRHTDWVYYRCSECPITFFPLKKTLSFRRKKSSERMFFIHYLFLNQSFFIIFPFGPRIKNHLLMTVPSAHNDIISQQIRSDEVANAMARLTC